MKVLLVSPPMPRTYWGAEYALRLTGRKALLPPLGLLTVAALLPRSWELRLVDMSVDILADEDLCWADVVMVSGMMLQKEALVEVAGRARAKGKRVVGGGAYASTSPGALIPHLDCVVVGEAENITDHLVRVLSRAGEPLPPVLEAAERPQLHHLPPPRFDLINVAAYQCIGLQWSRGCPFHCEFCDITDLYGHHPRTKTPQQFCGELDALYATGFRGSVFVVDDNFIGNRVATRSLLEAVSPWMRAHDHPFDFYTEASINLAADEALITAMVTAGFRSVFVGIETPSREALRSVHKMQNAAVDLQAAVNTLLASGLEVMGGFILGFDADGPNASHDLHRWIAQSAIPLAMVGMLVALPGTRLERRLRREGRMREEGSGDNLMRPNFQTCMGDQQLLSGYTDLMDRLYQPQAFFNRGMRMLELAPAGRWRFRRPRVDAYACLARSLWHQGLRSTYRRAYWHYLWQVITHVPWHFDRAMGLAIQGEHMIRYTHQDVLPRLRSMQRGGGVMSPRVCGAPAH